MTSDGNISRRKPTSALVQNLVRTRIPTRHGEFVLYYYANNLEKKEHLALVKGDVQGAIDVPVRLHSECITGDVFGSLRCDCGDQLDRALSLIGKSECGVLLYLRQEGRGIGLMKKMQAYNLQDLGLDTVEANLRLGHGEDERDYLIASAILRDLEIGSIRLITNNPKKINELRVHGIEVTDRIAIEVPYNPQNEGYLRTKASKMQHLLGLKIPQTSQAEFLFLDPLLQKLSDHAGNQKEGVFSTMTYLQSLNGHILDNDSALGRVGAPTALYAIEINTYLRGVHDASIIDVAYLKNLKREGFEGRAAQVLIWDEHLSCLEWVSSNSRARDIILCSRAALSRYKQRNSHCNNEIVPVDTDSHGNWLLDPVYGRLYESGMRTLLIEGGGGSLKDHLRGSGRVNYYVITTLPGICYGDERGSESSHPSSQNLQGISHCHYHAIDGGIILHGSTD